MLYICVKDQDGSVIAAERLEAPVYVQRQGKNGIIVRCSAVRAQGVLSANGEAIYQLEGRDVLGGDYLTAAKISEMDYDNMVLEFSGSTEEPDPVDPSEPEQSEEPQMTIPQMREKIKALEQEVASMEEQMDMLLTGAMSDDDVSEVTTDG